MLGKINPVIPEIVNQVAFEVIGTDTTISIAYEGGQLQLNVFEPLHICQVSPHCTISKAIFLNTSGKILNISGFV